MKSSLIAGVVLAGLLASVAVAQVRTQTMEDGVVVVENDVLTAKVSPVGGRLVSVVDKLRNREDVKVLPYYGGANIMRYGQVMNLNDLKDRYTLSVSAGADGAQKLTAVAKVAATEDRPAVATVTKTYTFRPGSECIAVSLEIANEGAEEIAFIPWVQHLLLRGLKSQPEETHMTSYGAYISGQPIPGQPQKNWKLDSHYFPAGNWSCSLLAPGEEGGHLFATVLKPADMLKVYDWHRGLEDFATQEVIASPIFAKPGASARWDYVLALAAPARNVVYGSPDLFIGVTPHPQGISADTKELQLAFAATRELTGVQAKGRLVSVADPKQTISEFTLDLAGLSPKAAVTKPVAVALTDKTNYQLRLSFTRDGKAYFPGEAVGDRDEAVIPIVVGTRNPDQLVYTDRSQRNARLRQIEPRALKAVRNYTSDAFDAFNYTTGERVFRGDTFTPTGEGAAKLYACAGEYESAQIILTAKPGRDATYVLSGGELTGPGGAKLAAESINQFLYAQTRMPSGYNARYALGEYPEALLPSTEMTVKAGEATPLFVTWRVPQDAKPGLYRGAVTLAAGGRRHELPVEMTVWNIAMPLRSPWMDTPSSLKGDSLPFALKDGKPLSRKDQLQAIVDMHLKYRLTPCDSGIVNNLLALKIPEFEAEMNHFVALGATKIYLGSAKQMLDRGLGNLPKAEQYLRDKGWIDYFYVRPGFDEASSDLIPQIRAVCEAWKKVSRIPLMETYYHEEPKGLYGMLDIYSRSVSDAPWIRERMAAGDRFWKVNAFTGHLEPAPWTIRKSYLSFFDYSFTGTYIWTVKNWGGVTKWGEDYWCDGGVGNLSAVLMWPHQTGVLSSIRLEALRDAVEDNALFWMLREKVKSMDGKPETAALKSARALLASKVSARINTVADLERLRIEAGEALSALNSGR